MTKQYIRFWCSECKNFTVHNIDGPCLICGVETKEYKISDVPIEFILQQRRRFKNKRSSNFNKILNNLYYPLGGIFEETNFNYEVIETDAGQLKLEEDENKERQKVILERKEHEEEYKLFYKGVGRNEDCPCGSNKKYKKCCISKFDDLKFRFVY